jgi:hypothetical protein
MCVGTDVHTPERGTHDRRGKLHRGAVFDAPQEQRCVGIDVHTPER